MFKKANSYHLVKTIITAFLLLSILFISAGTLFWIDAWILIILYSVYVSALLLWLYKKNPALVRERLRRDKGGKAWDKKLLAIYSVLLVLMLITCGLDAVRFQASRIPLWLKIVGYAGCLVSSWFIVCIFRVNPFLTAVVRIQTERSHYVVKSGPYTIVRHPMYTSVILLYSALPLAFGSAYAFIFTVLISLLYIFRTHKEDHTLQNELPGYLEYTRKTRYKLFPYIW